jgi:hypothetical protein
MPLTSEQEANFQSFVQRGGMDTFLQELEEEKKKNITPPRCYHQLDGTLEGQAKYEAILWQESCESFDLETRAYARLKDIQGKSIPRLYAHVRLMRPSFVREDLLQHPQWAPYFEIKGILLEYISSYNLQDIDTSPLAPSDRNMWSGIVQAAVDSAHDINKHGVLMEDCGPRNVMVDSHSQSPFIIDFAQCQFKDQITDPQEFWDVIERMREEADKENGVEGKTEDGKTEEGVAESEEEEEESEDWDPEIDYWERVACDRNDWAIGGVLATRLLKTRGFKLDIKYPDARKIIEELKAAKQVV